MTSPTRTVWLFGHRWIGLILGLVIALIGLSGSIIVFEDAIDTAWHPELHTVQPRKTMLPFGDLVTAARTVHPNKTFLFLLRDNDRRETSIYAMMAPKSRQVSGRTQVFLNPYTGAHLGSRPEETWFGAVHKFHGELLAGPVGETVVGALALVLVVSLSGGLILWWPSRGNWKRSLTIKSSGTTKRVLRDLHNVSGSYFFVVLFVCSVTALPLVWPNESKTVLSTVLGDPPVIDHPRASTPLENGSRITLGQAVDIAKAETPGHWVNLALHAFGPTGSHMIRTAPAGETSMANSITVFVDQYSGAVLDTAKPSQDHIVDALASDFAGTIHNGSILGLPGRVLVFIAGLAFPVLFVTGFMLWYRSKVSTDLVSELRNPTKRKK